MTEQFPVTEEQRRQAMLDIMAGDIALSGTPSPDSLVLDVNPEIEDLIEQEKGLGE